MNMSSKIKKIISFIAIPAILLAIVFVYFKYVKQDINNGNNVVVDMKENIYKNDKIGFEMKLPKSFNLFEERYNVRLFSEGGPIGDSVVFKKSDNKYLFLYHIEPYRADLLERFSQVHRGDQVPFDKIERIAFNAMVITHGLGNILIFKPENSIDYFEIQVGREIEDPKETLKQILESFKVLKNKRR